MAKKLLTTIALAKPYNEMSKSEKDELARAIAAQARAEGKQPSDRRSSAT
jgi:hypothetical protein